MVQPVRVLAWSDWILAPTGFGTVSRHVLGAMHQTGRYAIDHLAINYTGKSSAPSPDGISVTPATQADPGDPLGRLTLLRMLDAKDYDLLWILNEAGPLQPIADELQKIKAARAARGKTQFKTIVYFPVDCHVFPEAGALLGFADVAVAYTEFGRAQTLQVLPALKEKLRVIPHGFDIENFFPLDAAARQEVRARFGVPDPQTFVLINVNRNVPRKDIPRTLLAYARFRQKAPNSVLFLHTEQNRPPINLVRCCEALGLTPNEVKMPALTANGYPIAVLNDLYNLSDTFLTTTLGEGWGLTITEAMSAATPVVAPRNSSIPELLGDDGERGYLYPCKEQTWIDNGGYRPMGHLDDILQKLGQCFDQRNTSGQKEIIARARDFAQRHPWSDVCRQWMTLFDQMMASK